MNTRNLATLFTRRISLLHEAALWPWNANETLFFFHVDRWPMCRGGVGVFFFLSFFIFFIFFFFTGPPLRLLHDDDDDEDRTQRHGEAFIIYTGRRGGYSSLAIGSSVW